MSVLLRHPEKVLLTLTGLCLLVFLLTLALPRVDNQLIGSDGVRYYVYLPSLILDHDLDFTNEYRHFFSYAPGRAERALAELTPTGLLRNQWAFGPALLWSPFFLVAHLLGRLLAWMGLDLAVDGYGYWYQGFVLSGSILYGGLGLVFTHRFVRRFSSSEAALVSTVLVAFAGNLVYYMTAEPYMSHTVSVFASGLFFWAWAKQGNASGIKTAATYGFLAGVMALVRPQDGLFLALPFLFRLLEVLERAEQRNLHWKGWLRDAGVAGAVSLMTFAPQMLIWGQLYGNYFRSPYFYRDGAAFYWLAPKLGAVLFSAYRGLLTWHPVFLLALVGLLITYKRQRRLAIVCALGFAVQLYIVAAWHNWMQGDAFGGRMFIVCTPIFALGLSHLLERLQQHWSATVIALASMLLLVWNFLLFVAYRFDLAIAQRPPTWYDITVGRVSFFLGWIRELLI